MLEIRVTAADAGPEFRSNRETSSEFAATNAGTAMLVRGFAPLFQIYIFLVLALPSGSFMGVNFKLPLYVLLLPAAAAVFIHQKRRSVLPVTLLIAIPAIWLLWIALAIQYQFEAAGALRQYADILLTLLTCWMAALFCSSTRAGALRLLRTILFAEAFACALKVVLLAYAFIRGVPVTEIVATLDRVFGVDLMTMDLGALLGRIQFVSDSAIPLCLFATLRYRHLLRIGFLASAALMMLFSVSVLFSFSRYFWAFSVLAIVLGLVLARKDKTYWGLLSMALVLTFASLPLLSGLLQARTSQEVVTESDSTRTEQISALKGFFFDAPLLGHGLGTYVTTSIRSDGDAKYGYEVQLLALSGQVGIAGLTLLGLLCFYYYQGLWRRASRGALNKAVILVLLCAWLAAGLFNPLLLNPVGAISYVLLFCFVRLNQSSKQGRTTNEATETHAVTISSQQALPGHGR
jgi:O-antigen ligase